ncbi:uncharacterized protein An07g07220 [Aspergillus niger]|uniref:Contig An07c0210, genomic contig n=2 Tax=Aspergillus niger TaxID=5061 RepID=A2QNW2_ASPNC|nr:uncharacterized protein An07g07220 [Aspergillus niger]CAL00764.1 unnamed protein product [Aspergillus niger]
MTTTGMARLLLLRALAFGLFPASTPAVDTALAGLETYKHS